MHPQLTLRLIAPRPRPAKARSYFDTTLLPRAELAQAIARAEAQDDQVLLAFRAHVRLTPSECLRHLEAAGVSILITSVRRSISTLTDAGALCKTPDKRPGPWGMREVVWELVSPQARAA
jgi:hypothetical protein